MKRWLIMLLSLGIGSVTYGLNWQDWWVSRDRQAMRLLHDQHYAQAAQIFTRLDWRAMAAYRAGHYQEAARDYAQLRTIDGDYNAGNALAKLGQYQAAMTAYNRVLAIDPTHADAKFNRDLIQKLLDQQKQQQSSSESKQNKKQSTSKSSSTTHSSKQDTSSSTKSDASPDKKTPAAAPQQSDAADKVKKSTPSQPKNPKLNQTEREQEQAKQQWLRMVPDDPGGLLREKFLRDHLKRQNGSSS